MNKYKIEDEILFKKDEWLFGENCQIKKGIIKTVYSSFYIVEENKGRVVVWKDEIIKKVNTIRIISDIDPYGEEDWEC